MLNCCFVNTLIISETTWSQPTVSVDESNDKTDTETLEFIWRNRKQKTFVYKLVN